VRRTPGSAAAWAERYVRHLRLVLTPLEGKTPIDKGWNLDENLIRTASAARHYWTRHPQANMGTCLEPSGLASLDVDAPEARGVLAAEGVDVDALIRETPTIVGRNPRLEFRAPGDRLLRRKWLTWPPRAAGEKSVTVLELRAGRVQDVLPPSIHPDTRQPYTWRTPPKDDFPPLPEALLRLWLDFDRFKRRARKLCTWAPPEPEPPPPRLPRPLTGPSVIRAFNEGHDAGAILEAHGYIRVAKRRWRSPHCTQAPGVVRLPDGRIYCHDSDDPLGDAKAHDAFDLYTLFEHGGNQRRAVRAAAELLGMRGPSHV
jgi:putative DNA primase/helicase